MTATDELAQHEQRVAEAQQRARAIGRDLAEHNAKIGKLKQDKVEAHSREDEQLATKIRKQIDAAEAKIIDLEERQAGAQLAASRADGERVNWIADNYRDLIREIEPDAKRAARAIDKLADELLAALREWDGVKGRVAALAHTAGQTNQRAPSLGWDEISHALRRRPQPTAIPLPGQFGTAVVAAYDDPDPETRERARQETREKASG